jgi:uncharacterized protein YjbJ (UPF0337 family)
LQSSFGLRADVEVPFGAKARFDAMRAYVQTCVRSLFTLAAAEEMYFNKLESDVNKDQVEGRAKEAKGKIKEVAGKVVGNKTEETKGKAEKTVGKVQKDLGDLRNEVEKDSK